MSAANPAICPKCGYQRTAADTAPAWQCPSCGIAYNKFRDVVAPQPVDAAADSRQRTLSVGQGDEAGSTAMMVYGFVLLVFFILMFTMFAASQLSIVRWLPVAIGLCACLFWLGAYRRLRAVADVATSTVAGAAQGYVELRGRAVQATGDALVGYLTRTPCVWYRYEWRNPIEKGQQGSGERGVPFILRDATGDCLVDLRQAEVVCDRCEQWTEGPKIFQEWSIRVGDPVYAIGYFVSGSTAAKNRVDLEVAYALAEEQRMDAKDYTARYDANNDGEVDRLEAVRAHETLRRETMEKYLAQGGVHALGPSPAGRPFLVVGAGENWIIRRYRLLALIHLLVFFASLTLAGYLWLI